MRVRLVIRNALLREGVRLLIAGHPAVRTVVVDETDAAPDDVVICAVGLPGEDGLDYLREPDAGNVLALGGGTHSLLAALQAGARGCLPLSALPQEFAAALVAVARGDAYIHPSVARAVLADYRDRVEGREATSSVLTPREREVLVLLAEGYTNRAAAERLNLSARTVETHRANIMAKLDADTLADLIFAAIRLGLITP